MSQANNSSYRILLICLLLLPVIFEPVHIAMAAGLSWSSPIVVDSHAGNNILPRALQAGNGTLWVAWQSNRNGLSTNRYDIIYKTYTNGLWSKTWNLTTSGQNAGPSLVQLRNGTIVAFFALKQANSYAIFYKSYISLSWSSPVQVTFPQLNDTLPSATVAPNGTLWLFWTRVNNTCSSCTTSQQLFYRTYNMGAWSPETQLTNDSNQNYGPYAMVGKDGILRLVWSKGSGLSVYQLYYKTNNGATWTSDTQIVSSSSTDDHPSFIQDRNGTLWLFWDRLVVVSPLVQYYVLFGKYSYDLAGTWSAEIQLTSPPPTQDRESWMPSAVQSTYGTKPLWLFYSSNINAPEFDIFALMSSGVAPIHDVKISGFTVSNNLQYPGGMASVGQGAFVTITVLVTDPGDYSETVTATLTVSNRTSTTFNSLTGPVGPGNVLSLYFYWNTTVVVPGRYGLSATVAPVPGESLGNLGDNSLTQTNEIHILPFGDIDQDGSVTITDVSVFFYDYGFTSTCNCGRWNPYADLNNDGIIDLPDLGVAARNYGYFA